MIVVSDTSPISNLFLAGHLQLLPDTFGKVIVPERVFEEAIALAKELQADFLLIDEQEGRAFAMAEALRVVGVWGVLLEAKKQGLIPSVKFVMDELRTKSKFWVSEKVYLQVLQLAGEKTP